MLAKSDKLLAQVVGMVKYGIATKMARFAPCGFLLNGFMTNSEIFPTI